MTQPLVAHSFAIPIILFLTLWVLFYLPLAGVASLGKGAGRNAAARIGKTRLLKWVAGRKTVHGLRPYLPLLLVLLLGAIAAIAAAHLFVEVAQRVRDASSTISRSDQSVQAWFLQHRQPGVILLFRIFTFFGGGPGILLLVGVLGVLLVRKEPATAAYLLGTALGGYLLNLGLKMMFARTRPDLASAVISAHSYAFPSGHAMESFVVYGAVAFLALRQPWPWMLNSAILALAVTMVILIGLSRVYLGVHWVSDIAGGWSAGLVWLVAATLAFHMLLRAKPGSPARQPA